MKTFLGGVAAALFSVSSFAADMPARAPSSTAPVLAAAPVFNWSGFYIGIVGGGGWGRTEQIAPGPSSTGHFDVSGGTVGGTVGFNWQSGAAVFGIEGDYSWANIDGSTTAVCGVPCETNLRSLGTARARLGYASGQFMPYLTGGYAFGNLRRGFGNTFGSKTTDGWTIGAGVETLFARNWTGKVEYLYADFGRMNVPIAGFPTTVDLQTHLVRVGLNYKF